MTRVISIPAMMIGAGVGELKPDGRRFARPGRLNYRVLLDWSEPKAIDSTRSTTALRWIFSVNR